MAPLPKEGSRKSTYSQRRIYDISGGCSFSVVPLALQRILPPVDYSISGLSDNYYYLLTHDSSFTHKMMNPSKGDIINTILRERKAPKPKTVITPKPNQSLECFDATIYNFLLSTGEIQAHQPGDDLYDELLPHDLPSFYESRDIIDINATDSDSSDEFTIDSSSSDEYSFDDDVWDDSDVLTRHDEEMEDLLRGEEYSQAMSDDEFYEIHGCTPESFESHLHLFSPNATSSSSIEPRQTNLTRFFWFTLRFMVLNYVYNALEPYPLAWYFVFFSVWTYIAWAKFFAEEQKLFVPASTYSTPLVQEELPASAYVFLFYLFYKSWAGMDVFALFYFSYMSYKYRGRLPMSKFLKFDVNFQEYVDVVIFAQIWFSIARLGLLGFRMHWLLTCDPFSFETIIVYSSCWMWVVIGAMFAYSFDIKDKVQRSRNFHVTGAFTWPLLMYGFLPHWTTMNGIDECLRQQDLANSNQSFTDSIGLTTCIPNSTSNSSFVEDFPEDNLDESTESPRLSPDLSLPAFIKASGDYFIPDLSLPAFVKADNDYSTLTIDIVDFFRKAIEQVRSQPITSGFAIVCLTNFFSTLPVFNTNTNRGLTSYFNTISKTVIVTVVPIMAVAGLYEDSSFAGFDDGLRSYGVKLCDSVKKLLDKGARMAFNFKTKAIESSETVGGAVDKLDKIVAKLLSIVPDSASETCGNLFQELFSDSHVNGVVKALTFSALAASIRRFWPKETPQITSGVFGVAVNEIVNKLSSETTIATLIATIGVSVTTMLFKSVIGQGISPGVREVRRISNLINSNGYNEMMLHYRDCTELCNLSQKYSIKFNGCFITNAYSLIDYIKSEKINISKYQYLRGPAISIEVKNIISTFNKNLIELQQGSRSLRGASPFVNSLYGSGGCGKSISITYTTMALVAEVVKILSDPVLLSQHIDGFDSGAIAVNDGRAMTLSEVAKHSCTKNFGSDYDQNDMNSISITLEDAYAQNPQFSQQPAAFLAYFMQLIDNSAPATKAHLTDKDTISICPQIPVIMKSGDLVSSHKTCGFVWLNTNTIVGMLRELCADDKCYAALLRRMCGSHDKEITLWELELNPHAIFHENPCWVEGSIDLKMSRDNVLRSLNEYYANGYITEKHPFHLYRVKHNDDGPNERIFLYRLYPIFVPHVVNKVKAITPSRKLAGERPLFDADMRSMSIEGWFKNDYLTGPEYLKYIKRNFVKRFFTDIASARDESSFRPSTVARELVDDPLLGDNFVSHSTLNDPLNDKVAFSFEDCIPSIMFASFALIARCLFSYITCYHIVISTRLLNVCYVYLVYKSLPLKVILTVCVNYKVIVLSCLMCMMFLSLEPVALTVTIFYVVSLVSEAHTHAVGCLHPFAHAFHGFSAYFFCAQLDDFPTSYVLYTSNWMFCKMVYYFGFPTHDKMRLFRIPTFFCCFSIVIVSYRVFMTDECKHKYTFFIIYLFNCFMQCLVSCRKLKNDLHVETCMVEKPRLSWWEGLIQMGTTCSEVKLVCIGLLTCFALSLYNMVFPRVQGKSFDPHSTWNDDFSIKLSGEPDRTPDKSRSDAVRSACESVAIVNLLFRDYGWVPNVCTVGNGCFYIPTHCLKGSSIFANGKVHWRENSCPIRIHVIYKSGSFLLDTNNLNVLEVGVDTAMVRCNHFINSTPIENFTISDTDVAYAYTPEILYFGPTDPTHIAELEKLGEDFGPTPELEDVVRAINRNLDDPFKRKEYMKLLSRVKLLRHLSETTDFNMYDNIEWLRAILTQGRVEFVRLSPLTLQKVSQTDTKGYNHMTNTKLESDPPPTTGDSVWCKPSTYKFKVSIVRCSVPEVIKASAPVVCGLPIMRRGTIIGMQTGSSMGPDGKPLYMIARCGFYSDLHSMTLEESYGLTFGTEITTTNAHKRHCWVNFVEPGQRIIHVRSINGDRGNYKSKKPAFKYHPSMSRLNTIMTSVHGDKIHTVERKTDLNSYKQSSTKVLGRYTTVNPKMRLPSCQDFVASRLLCSWIIIASDFFPKQDLTVLEPWDFDRAVTGDDLVGPLQGDKSTGIQQFPGALRNHLVLDGAGSITSCVEGSELMAMSKRYYDIMYAKSAGVSVVTKNFPKVEKHSFDKTGMSDEEFTSECDKACRIIQNVPTTTAITLRCAFSFMLRFFSHFNAIWSSPYGKPPYAEASVCVHYAPGERFTACSLDIKKMDASIDGDISNVVFKLWRDQVRWMSMTYDKKLESAGMRTYAQFLPLFDNAVYALQHWWSVSDGYATYIHHGNISGSPITTHFNIMCGIILLYNTAITELMNFGFDSNTAWDYVQQYVNFSVYGDDMHIVVAEPGNDKLRKRMKNFTAGWIARKIEVHTGFQVTHDDVDAFLSRSLVGEFMMLKSTSLTKCYGMGPKEWMTDDNNVTSFLAGLLFVTSIELSASPIRYEKFINAVLNDSDHIIQKAVLELVIRADCVNKHKVFFGAHHSMVNAILKLSRPVEMRRLRTLHRNRLLIGRSGLISAGRIAMISSFASEDVVSSNKNYVVLDQSYLPAIRVLTDNSVLKSLYLGHTSDIDYDESTLTERNAYLSSVYNKSKHECRLSPICNSLTYSEEQAVGSVQELERWEAL